MKRLRVVAIVPAAGSGHRLGSRTKKPFVLLGGAVGGSAKALNVARHNVEPKMRRVLDFSLSGEAEFVGDHLDAVAPN